MYTQHSHFGRIIFGAALFALVSVFVLILWNWLMPAIFGLGQVNYLQSAGLLLLSKILFSGFGRGRHHIGERDLWRNKFEMRFGNRNFHEAEKGD
jgi:hypothetical protein